MILQSIRLLIRLVAPWRRALERFRQQQRGRRPRERGRRLRTRPTRVRTITRDSTASARIVLAKVFRKLGRSRRWSLGRHSALPPVPGLALLWRPCAMRIARDCDSGHGSGTRQAARCGRSVSTALPTTFKEHAGRDHAILGRCVRIGGRGGRHRGNSPRHAAREIRVARIAVECFVGVWLHRLHARRSERHERRGLARLTVWCIGGFGGMTLEDRGGEDCSRRGIGARWRGGGGPVVELHRIGVETPRGRSSRLRIRRDREDTMLVSIRVIIGLGGVRICIILCQRGKSAILIKRWDRIGRIDDNNVRLFKVLDEGVQVWKGNAATCIIAALPDRVKDVSDCTSYST